jgi:hypothetical protein
MMIKLEKPDMEQKDIIDVCIGNLKKEPTLSNIKRSRAFIERKSSAYNTLGERGELGKIPMHSKVPGGATKDDMVWIYDKKFVRDEGRSYYDKIMKIPPFARCPFCGVRRVSTLDHYLAKTEYPTFAITPNNLIASCADCNKKKSNLVYKNREDELFHPYYDEFDDEIWLKANVMFKNEILFEFYVEKPENWTDEKYTRAKNHFDKLELNNLYISHAAEEFSECQYSLKRIYETGGNDLVQIELLDRIKEHRSNMKNTWRAALYEGLLNSKDFFDIYLGGRSN